jgi:hypothetical protein
MGCEISVMAISCTMNQLLMKAQIAREVELARAQWITDRAPPRIGTYLTSCVNGDKAVYCACHYWNEEWQSPGPFVRVLGWQELPLPLITKLDE